MYPYAPCMEYLPTFGLILLEMYVNMPYMEHLGYNGVYISIFIYIYITQIELIT